MNGMLDLEELALETGSTIRYPDGRQFNAGGMQGRRLKRPAEPSKVVAAPPPPAAPKSELTPELMQQILAMLNRPVEVRLPDMPAPQVTVQANESPRKPVQWSFEFERNPNGTIKRITASPQE